MASYEVSEPILNSPFEKPSRYWYIREGEQPELRAGRRPPIVFPPRDQKEPWTVDGRLLAVSKEYPTGFELAERAGAAQTYIGLVGDGVVG
jgi:type III restriction enzyme